MLFIAGYQVEISNAADSGDGDFVSIKKFYANFKNLNWTKLYLYVNINIMIFKQFFKTFPSPDNEHQIKPKSGIFSLLFDRNKIR